MGSTNRETLTGSAASLKVNDLHTRVQERELVNMVMSPEYIKAYLRLPEISKNRVDMTTFTNRVDLATDITRVNQKLSAINDPDKKYDEGEKEALIMSDVLEGLLFDKIANGKLFGENVKAAMPSIYDDLFLGNDLILEQSNDGFYSYSGLGIDITFGNNNSLKKMEIIRRKILKGQAGSIKYFLSPDGNIKGSQDNIAIFVIGLDRSNMFKATQAWNGDSKSFDAKIKSEILWQMLAQCKYFQKTILNHLAKNRNTLNEYNVFQLKNVLSIYQAEEKRIEKIIKDTGTNISATDEVSKSLMLFMEKRDDMSDSLFRD